MEDPVLAGAFREPVLVAGFCHFHHRGATYDAHSRHFDSLPLDSLRPLEPVAAARSCNRVVRRNRGSRRARKLLTLPRRKQPDSSGQVRPHPAEDHAEPWHRHVDPCDARRNSRSVRGRRAGQHLRCLRLHRPRCWSDRAGDSRAPLASITACPVFGGLVD